MASGGADVVRTRPHAAVAFRRDHDVRTLDADILKRLSGHLLGYAERIDVGGVEEVDAGLQ